MKRWLATLAALLMVMPAAAQDGRDCANPQTQQDMNYCAAVAFDEADRALNVAWKHVRNTIEKRDADMPADMQGWPEALLTAQRAWLQYRDAHCESEGFQFRGGSMEPLIVASCKANATRLRTQELLLLVEEY